MATTKPALVIRIISIIQVPISIYGVDPVGQHRYTSSIGPYNIYVHARKTEIFIMILELAKYSEE